MCIICVVVYVYAIFLFFLDELLYLCIIIVDILLTSVGRISIVLLTWIECVDNNLLGALYFRPAEGTSLEEIENKNCIEWRRMRKCCKCNQKNIHFSAADSGEWWGALTKADGILY